MLNRNLGQGRKYTGFLIKNDVNLNIKDGNLTVKKYDLDGYGKISYADKSVFYGEKCNDTWYGVSHNNKKWLLKLKEDNEIRAMRTTRWSSSTSAGSDINYSPKQLRSMMTSSS